MSESGKMMVEAPVTEEVGQGVEVDHQEDPEDLLPTHQLEETVEAGVGLTVKDLEKDLHPKDPTLGQSLDPNNREIVL